MDHVEYVDGFELLIGTEFCQPDDAGTVVGKGRGDCNGRPAAAQVLLAQNAVCLKHSCRAVRLVEHVPVSGFRNLADRVCRKRVQLVPLG